MCLAFKVDILSNCLISGLACFRIYCLLRKKVFNILLSDPEVLNPVMFHLIRVLWSVAAVILTFIFLSLPHLLLDFFDKHLWANSLLFLQCLTGKPGLPGQCCSSALYVKGLFFLAGTGVGKCSNHGFNLRAMSWNRTHKVFSFQLAAFRICLLFIQRP